jgi:PhnB protein
MMMEVCMSLNCLSRCIFHIHEEKSASEKYEPTKNKGITTLIGLFVEDVNAVMKKALDAGATLLNPAKDYEYGYRQGEFKDPFGHHWMIETKIESSAGSAL